MDEEKFTLGEIMDLVNYISVLHHALKKKNLILGGKGQEEFNNLSPMFKRLIVEQDARHWLGYIEGRE